MPEVNLPEIGMLVVPIKPIDGLPFGIIVGIDDEQITVRTLGNTFDVSMHRDYFRTCTGFDLAKIYADAAGHPMRLGQLLADLTLAIANIQRSALLR